MTEPRIDGPLGDLTFRNPGRSTPSSGDGSQRFWLGVAIFLGVALAYPFYSYQVHAQLMARDMSAAMTQLNGEMEAMSQEANRQSAEASARSAAQSAAARKRGVVIAGTTIIGGTRVVIVQLGEASLAEAKGVICKQAEVRFREPLAGQSLRIQRHRGSQPAVEMGTITCG